MFKAITIRTISKDGWPVDFELKDGQQPKPAIEWLEEHGYEPAVMLDGTAVAAPTEGQFSASTLTATIDDGKAAWKVKGGVYQKFGVRIWPEVLAEIGVDVDNINPLKPVDLSGYTAHFVTNENGQPRKVVRLVKDGE